MARPADNFPVKRKELLAVAERVFLRKGYDQASVEDILKASGVSKGAFYHYFKSKEEVLAAGIDDLLDEAVAFLTPVVDDPELRAVEKFRRFMVRKSEFQTGRLEYAALLGKLMQSEVFRRNYVVTSARKMVPLFSRIIRQGVEEGVFRVEYPDETAEILIRTIVGVPDSFAFDEYLSDAEKRRRYVAALQGVVAGTLGIGQDEFSMY